jgi:hypothetical protein
MKFDLLTLSRYELHFHMGKILLKSLLIKIKIYYFVKLHFIGFCSFLDTTPFKYHEIEKCLTCSRRKRNVITNIFKASILIVGIQLKFFFLFIAFKMWFIWKCGFLTFYCELTPALYFTIEELIRIQNLDMLTNVTYLTTWWGVLFNRSEQLYEFILDDMFFFSISDLKMMYPINLDKLTDTTCF